MGTDLPLLRGLLLLALCLPGCLTRSRDGRDLLDLEVPATYQAAARTAGERNADVGWIDQLGAPSLSTLVEEALERNRDLKVASSRMDAAGASARVTGADRLPQLSFDADARRFQRVLTQSSRLVGSGADDVTRDRVNDYGLAMRLNWEIDLWGKLSDRTRAARTEYVASQAEYYAARLSLAAATAGAWFNLLEAESQYALAKQTLENFTSAYEIVDRGFNRGVNPALDVRLAKANVAGAEARVNIRDRQRDGARKSLEVLLGRYPAGTLASAGELPALTSPIPSGLPSELLNRRPDLVAAEYRLEASLDRSLASRKERLPSLTLTGNAGISSDELARALDLDRLVWNIAAGITQPVFQGGRIEGNIELSDARQEEALQGYAQQVLEAFEEVERSLAAERFLVAEVRFLDEAARESTAAEELALDEYQKGLVDITTVLDSQRRSFESRSALLEARNLLLQNRIDLYLALGGDFQKGS